MLWLELLQFKKHGFKFFIVFGIICSIGLTYHVKVVEKDYYILTNPDGPDTSDYFDESSL